MKNLAIMLLLGLMLFSSPSYAYKLYGYEDDLGLHLSETQRNDSYVLLYAAPQRPRLSYASIRKRLKAMGAVKRSQLWVRQKRQVSKIVSGAQRGRHGSCRAPRRVPGKSILACIERAGQAQKLDPRLLYAVIERESGFDANAVSSKGAQGLMQLMPATQQQWGVTAPFDPEQNIHAGARHLRWLLDKFSNLQLALAAYNAGHVNVIKYGGVPPFPETKIYVARIMERYQILQGG